MTEKKPGIVLYDGACPICLGMITSWGSTLRSRGFDLVPLQEEWVRKRLGLSENDLLKEMRVITPDDKVLGAIDAYVFIWRRIWWCLPLWLLAHIPGIRFLMESLYRWVAKNRMGLSGACPLPQASHERKGTGISGWLPLITLPTTTMVFKNHFQAEWIFMWTLAFAIYFGCKWLTFIRARFNGVKSGLGRSLGYLLLWPGMDAKRFIANSEVADKPAIGEWLTASLKFITGAIILWGLTPRIGEANHILSAWLGMLGIVLILHFGSFHLISLAWRSFGVIAEPIMRSPITSTSLSLFWSERWNRGFNQLAHDLVFHATYRQMGVSLGILLVFLVSGLVHDLVISLPAGALFGLPTTYFMIQGIGVLLERSGFGKSLGLKSGFRGWLFMCIFTTGPAYWLFHEPFLLNVILPFLKAINAL